MMYSETRTCMHLALAYVCVYLASDLAHLHATQSHQRSNPHVHTSILTLASMLALSFAQILSHARARAEHRADMRVSRYALRTDTLSAQSRLADIIARFDPEKKPAALVRGSHLSNTCVLHIWRILQQIKLAALDKQCRRKQTRPF